VAMATRAARERPPKDIPMETPSPGEARQSAPMNVPHGRRRNINLLPINPK
jgi:hypothetical protein